MNLFQIWAWELATYAMGTEGGGDFPDKGGLGSALNLESNFNLYGD